VFARHRELTMGPLSVGVAWLLQLGGTNGLARAMFLAWILGPVALVLLERAALRVRGRSDVLLVRLCTLLGGAALLHTWQRAAGGMGHLDDVLTMTFAALAVWAVATGREWVLVVAIGCAAAAKPWGLLLLPLALAPHLRDRGRTAAASCVAIALPWLPFELADRSTFGATSYRQAVDPASGLAALGVHDAQMPHWVRPAQVLLGLALAAFCVLRRHWGGALAAALAARLALDPQVYGYYASSFVLGALAFDLVALRRPLPIASLTTYVCVEVVPDWVHDGGLVGRVRVLAAAVTVVLVVTASARSGTSRSCTTP
jgi:hypothetical protein